MHSIDSTGFWHLPDASEAPVSGTLHYSAQTGIILSLTGTLRETVHATEAITYPLIHGVIAESPYEGKLVTLVNCFRRRTRLAIPGFELEEIRANRAYIGTGHLANEDLSRFVSVRANYAHLDEWSNLSGFRDFEPEYPEPGVVVVRYEEPRPQELRIDGGNSPLLEVQSAKSTRDRHFEITEQVQLTFSDAAGFTPQHILRELISPFGDFLTFAVDRPSPLDDILLIGESPDGERRVHLLFQPIYKPRDDWAPSLSDMLFTRQEVVSAHPNVLGEWLRLRRQFKIPFDVYFGLLYGPPAYLETKFRLLVTALSQFLAGRVSDRAIRDAIDSLRRATPDSSDGLWIDMLPSPEELCLPQGIHTVIAAYRELMISALGHGADEFLAALIEMKRYLFEHRDSVEARSSTQLLLMVERLTLLTKVVILEHLGFSHAEIVTVISRNKTYHYLVRQAR